MIGRSIVGNLVFFLSLHPCSVLSEAEDRKVKQNHMAMVQEALHNQAMQEIADMHEWWCAPEEKVSLLAHQPHL